MPQQPPNFLRAFDVREAKDKPTAEQRSDYVKKWGWHLFSANIGTAAVGIVIANIPYAFNGQHAIGCIYYFINLLLLIINVTMTAMRAARHREVFKQSFFDHNEAIWFPVTGLTWATFIIMTLLYGVPYVGTWLVVACEVMFYIHLVYSCAILVIMENTLRTVPRPLKYMGPTDALDCYPIMFLGVVGGTLAPEVFEYSPSRALVVVILGYIGQGLGFLIGLLKLAVWMTRKQVFSRAPPTVIPTFIVAVGIPGFTAFSLLTLGNAALDVFPANSFLSGSSANVSPDVVAQIFYVAGIWFSLLLTGMASYVLLTYMFWAVLSFVREPLKDPRQRWAFSWWSWDFPLTGLAVSFARLATWFPSRAFGVIMIIMVLFMAIISILNIIGTINMMIKGKLPGTADEFHEMQAKTNGGERPVVGNEPTDLEDTAALFAPPRV